MVVKLLSYLHDTVRFQHHTLMARQNVGRVHDARFSTPSESPPILGEKGRACTFVYVLTQTCPFKRAHSNVLTQTCPFKRAHSNVLTQTCPLKRAHSNVLTQTCPLKRAHSNVLIQTCSLKRAHPNVLTQTCSFKRAHPNVLTQTCSFKRARSEDARSVRISLPKTGEGSGGVDIEEPPFAEAPYTHSVPVISLFACFILFTSRAKTCFSPRSRAMT